MEQNDTPAIQWSDLKKKWLHLSSVPVKRVSKRQQIDVLIGSDQSIFHRVLQEVYGNKPDYHGIARLTHLGWVCFGPTLVEDFRHKTICLFTLTYRTSHVNSEESVISLLRSLWELDSMVIKYSLSMMKKML